MPTTNSAALRRFRRIASESAKQIGARAKARREELGLKQHEVARLVHTTHDQVSRWERGLHVPRDLQPLADALQVDKSYFHVPEPDKRQTPRLFGGGRRAADDLAARLEKIEERMEAPAAVDRLEGALEDRITQIERMLEQQNELLAVQTAVLKEIRTAIAEQRGVNEAAADLLPAIRELVRPSPTEDSADLPQAPPRTVGGES